MLLWLRRRSPERVWAADQVTRGRLLQPAVSISILEGVIGGAAMVAAGVLGDLAALRVDRFVPSISREIDAVGASLTGIVGDTLGAASFLAIGIALAVEALNRLRLHPIVSTLIVAVAAGLVAAANQNAVLAGLPLIAGLAAARRALPRCSIATADCWPCSWPACLRA